VEQEWPTIVLMRPDFSDISLSAAIEDLRSFSDVPLLVLGNQGDEQEAITSLESCADDYVRLSTVNPATYEAFLGEQRLNLTTTEFRMLHLLMKNWGIAVAHQMLAGTLREGKGDSYGLAKKCVQHLRHKLGDDARNPHWVAAVHGIGYCYSGPHQGHKLCHRSLRVFPVA